jgi:hypothetical protein
LSETHRRVLSVLVRLVEAKLLALAVPGPAASPWWTT